MKRLWKKYRSISAKTKKRFAATMVFIAVVFANLSPIFAQQGVNSYILNSPSSSAILHFGTPEESCLMSGGECCNNGFLGGIGGSGIVEPLSVLVTGTTGSSLACAKDDLLSKGDPSKILSIVDSASGGLVGGVGNAVALLLEQRPASGIDYIEQQVYALTNPGQVSAQEPPAYYRGTGFDLLKPMQAFWGWSVNIVYALMILIVIFVAFGIIFRTSLNGGVVVALQSAIPNIVLAMILVPLSYAITGLFVDGITVGVNVVHQFLIGNGSPGNEIYQNRNEEFPIDNLLSVRLGNSTDPERDFDRGLYADDIRLSWVYVSANLGYTERLRPAIINIASYFPIGDAIESVANSFIGDALLVVVNLVIGFILLWTGARILWLLLGKFVAFLVGPLFAPFIFATVALPSGGTKMIFSYLKTIGAASLYYIVAYAMFLLAMVIASDYILVQVAAVGTPNFMPPLLGLEIFDPNASGGGQVIPGGLISLYLTAASLVIYMLIPSTLKKIDAMLGVNDGGIMAIFNDVKKSVSDSVGMAKAWRDGGKKYLYNGLVGGTGRLGNLASRSLTGRNLNGADGWWTNQYRRWSGGARQSISSAQESGNVLTRFAARTAGRVLTRGLDTAESTIGGKGSQARSTDKDKPSGLKVEVKGGPAGFAADKGNIMITNDGLMGLVQMLGFSLSDLQNSTKTVKKIDPKILPIKLGGYKLIFQIENGSFADVMQTQDIIYAVARQRSGRGGPSNPADQQGNWLSRKSVDTSQVFKRTAGGLGTPFEGGVIRDDTLNFEPDPRLGPPPANFNIEVGQLEVMNQGLIDETGGIGTQAGKQFAIKCNLVLSITSNIEFMNFFGTYDPDIKKFSGGSYFAFGSKGLESRDIVFKVGGLFSNGDYKSVEPVSVALRRGW